MRKREQIERDFSEVEMHIQELELGSIVRNQRLLLEVLLDLREILSEIKRKNKKSK